MKKILHFVVLACTVLILIAVISTVVYFAKQIYALTDLGFESDPKHVYLLVINILAVLAAVGIIVIDVRALLIDFSPALQKRAKEREEARRVKAEENRLKQIDERERRIKQLEEELNDLKKGD